MFDLFATRFDGDIDYLKSLHLRVNKLADVNAIPDPKNNLWILWSNMKLMFDLDDYAEVMYFTACMARRIDQYSTDHMLTGDQTVAKILYELDSIKPCAYERLQT